MSKPLTLSLPHTGRYGQIKVPISNMEPHLLTYEWLEDSVGGIFRRDMVVCIENAQPGRVFKGMFLVAKLVQETAQSLKTKKERQLWPGLAWPGPPSKGVMEIRTHWESADLFCQHTLCYLIKSDKLSIKSALCFSSLSLFESMYDEWWKLEQCLLYSKLANSHETGVWVKFQYVRWSFIPKCPTWYWQGCWSKGRSFQENDTLEWCWTESVDTMYPSHTRMNRHRHTLTHTPRPLPGLSEQQTRYSQESLVW